MLRPRTHAWTQIHHLMKDLLETILLYKHQLLYGTYKYFSTHFLFLRIFHCTGPNLENVKPWKIAINVIDVKRNIQIIKHIGPVLLNSNISLLFRFFCLFAKSVGAVENTDCNSAEGLRPPTDEYPGNDTKQSDGEVPAVLELWGMRSTPLLPSTPGPLWPGVAAPDRTLSMG